jgi:hypothetical protein
MGHKQYVFDYANRRKGHIVTRDEQTYLIAVYPAEPAWVGSLDVDVASSFNEAVECANKVAGEDSSPEDWQRH